MMHGPSDEEIERAEGRVTQSRRAFVASRARARTALRATLVKPVTLFGVALAAGAAGYLIFKRPQVKAADDWRARWSALRASFPNWGASSSGTATAAAASTSVAGIIVAFAMRYAMQRLPGIGLRLAEQAVRKGAAWSRAERASTAPSNYRSATSLH